MLTKHINGYVVEIVPIGSINKYFVTLTDEKQQHHHFTLVNSQGKLVIRNSLTVPAFINNIEPEIVKDL